MIVNYYSNWQFYIGYVLSFNDNKLWAFGFTKPTYFLTFKVK